MNRLFLGVLMAALVGSGMSCATESFDDRPPDASTCMTAEDCAGEPSTPVCHPSLAVCVQCVGDDDCDDAACDTDTYVCVECAGDEDCADGVCNLDIRQCVQCLVGGDCPSGECDPATNTCTGCAENTDCTATEASRCDQGTAACVACETAADCTHLDLAACTSEGVCVACTPETEADDCDAKSCDPATNTCGPHDRGTRGSCQACVSDSDCQGSRHCVPMEFPEGTPRDGGWCLELSGSCERPFTVVTGPRTTLSGVTGNTYCGINEDVVTCEALKALQDDLRCDPATEGVCFPAGDEAAAIEAPGALCRTFTGLAGNRCTYQCAGTPECPTTASQSTCGDGDEMDVAYCGG
jgi:hypothetical protein